MARNDPYLELFGSSSHSPLRGDKRPFREVNAGKKAYAASAAAAAYAATPGKGDDFQTDPRALEPLFDLIEPGGTVWECAVGQGHLSRAMSEHGWTVLGTDIRTGHDFLTSLPAVPWAAVITNPPYSKKDAFIERCYSLGKPFALLMPLTALEGQQRQRFYRERGLQVIVLPSRIEFTTPNGKTGGSWFASAWFTWGFELARDLTFWLPSTPEELELR